LKRSNRGQEFEELVRANQSMVFSLAYHFLHDRAAAEEVAQEAFLALHRNLDRIDSARHAVFWLRKVTVQRAIDEARRRKRHAALDLAEMPEPASGAVAGDVFRDEMLRRMVASLPDAARAVMVLRYQEDLDPAEIADVLEMPLGTVKSHLHRSLALLREKLERRGVGEFGWTG
jgi:RNA polymerase sigma-70 factor, ECF subfamily